MGREFKREGLGYVLRVPEVMTELGVDRLTRSRGETHGELSVLCGMPGSRSADGHIHQARFSLSSTSARSSVSRVLAVRSGAPDIDWMDLLEDLCRRVLAAEREGDPIVRVGGLPVETRETYRLDQVLPQDQTTILYADGGTGKSTLAVAMAVSVETGISVIPGWIPAKEPVLYLDWEAGRASINRRVRGVAMGAHIPFVVTIDYLDCRRRGPLPGFVEEIARLVDRGHYGLVVVDSVGMASGSSSDGGDANETAVRLFAAFGYLGTTVLAIDHVNKTDADAEPGRKSRPYGSVYKSNLARATYELRRSGESPVLGVYHTKANDSGLQPPVSLRVEHGDDGSITYTRLDASELPSDLERRMPLIERIARLLADQHLHERDIAEELGADKNVVRTMLGQRKDRFNRLPSGLWEVIPNAS
jgi:hypothetical protein